MTDARVLADAPWLSSGPAARVLALLNGDGAEARVVGGAVRNALLGMPVSDLDIATTALPAEVIRRATVPVLGVCLGHQGIALEFGGAVERVEPAHGQVCRIEHADDSLFLGVPSQFDAVRYHSLAVAETLPHALRKIAWSPDGTVMAMRHVSRPLWGLQFHPESIATEYGHQILQNFLQCQ